MEAAQVHHPTAQTLVLHPLTWRKKRLARGRHLKKDHSHQQEKGNLMTANDQTADDLEAQGEGLFHQDIVLDHAAHGHGADHERDTGAHAVGHVVEGVLHGDLLQGDTTGGTIDALHLEEGLPAQEEEVAVQGEGLVAHENGLLVLEEDHPALKEAEGHLLQNDDLMLITDGQMPLKVLGNQGLGPSHNIVMNLQTIQHCHHHLNNNLLNLHQYLHQDW